MCSTWCRPTAARIPAPRLVVLVAVAAGFIVSCGGDEPAAREPFGETLQVPWAAGSPGSGTSPAAIRWGFIKGQRYAFRTMEHSANYDRSPDDEGAIPLLAQMVERTTTLEVVDGPSSVDGASVWTMRLLSPDVVVRPAPGSWATKLSRALEAVEFEIRLAPGKAQVRLASTPSKAAALDAWRLSTHLGLALMAPPADPKSVSFAENVSIEIGAAPAFVLEVRRDMQNAGVLPCGEGDQCRAIAGRIHTRLRGEFLGPSIQGSASGEGHGTVQAQARASGNENYGILDGVLLNYEEVIEVHDAEGDRASTRFLRRSVLASLSAL